MKRGALRKSQGKAFKTESTARLDAPRRGILVWQRMEEGVGP